MKVSVVIPVFNQKKQLKLTLYGFNLQTISSDCYEVIVVDDGSDSELEIYESEYNYSLHIIRQSNSGRSAARNNAIIQANGDLIIMNDADRIPSSDFIANHLEFHNIDDNAVVIGNPQELYLVGAEDREEEIKELINSKRILKFSKNYNYAKVVSGLFNEEGATKSSIPWISFFSGNSSVKKDILKKVGLFNLQFETWGFEHFELGYRLFENGYPFYYSKNAINSHIIHLRETNYYIDHFKESTKIFRNITNDPRIDELYAFLTGKISLQKLEEIFGGDRANLVDDKERYFIINNLKVK